jgi:hypothetical protein
MQKRKLIKQLFTVCALFALSACARDNALGRAEQSCLKYPTPTARAECEARAKADNAAFLKESQKIEEATKARALAEEPAQEASTADAKSDVKKKNSLCFKRESTGEVVCPN